MFDPGRHTTPITFIFRIFIIQCLLLDGLLCYQNGGNSNPPSPRHHPGYSDNDIHDVTHEAHRPSSQHGILSGRSMNQDKIVTNTKRGHRMPSTQMAARDMSVKERRAQDKTGVKTKDDVIADHQPHRYPGHYQRSYHQAVASRVAERRGRDRRKNSPRLSPITTTTTVSYHHRRIAYPHQSATSSHKLQGKKKHLQGVNRYEVLSDLHENNPPSFDYQTTQHTPTKAFYTHPHLLQSQKVSDEDWDKLLKIDNGHSLSSKHDSALKRPNIKTSKGPYDPLFHPSYKQTIPESSRGSSKRSQYNSTQSHDMYQADEPDGDDLEAYIQALHHIEEMSTCSTVRCKDPQPFVHYMYDPYNRNYLFMPQCTILHRCMNFSGCCGDMSRECVPKKTMVIRKAFIVVDASNTRSGSLTYGPRDTQMIKLVNHTECECRQKPRPKPCTKRCPVPFRLRQEGHDCLCYCQSGASADGWDCDKLQHGISPLSTDGLVCIKEGNCIKPQCIYGKFDVKTGFCPLSDQYALPAYMFDNSKDRRHYRKHLSHLNPANRLKGKAKASTHKKNIPTTKEPKKVTVKSLHNTRDKIKGNHRVKKTGLEQHKSKHKEKPVVKFHSKTDSSTKTPNKKRTHKPGKQNSKRSKGGKKIKHGKTFTAHEYLDKALSPGQKFHRGQKRYISYGRSYEFKKQNAKPKSKLKSTTAEPPLPPQPLTMTQKRPAPNPKKQLPAVSAKTSYVTAMFPNSTAASTSPVKSFQSRLQASTTSPRPLSPVNIHPKAQGPVNTTKFTSKVFTNTAEKSTAHSQEKSVVTYPFSLVNSSPQPLPFFKASSPHIKTLSSQRPLSSAQNLPLPPSLKPLHSSTTTSHRMTSSSKTSSNIVPSSSTPASYGISTQSSKIIEKFVLNKDTVETFNEKDDTSSNEISSKYNLDSSESFKKSKEKVSSIDDNTEDASLESDSLFLEGSGSDAEN